MFLPWHIYEEAEADGVQVHFLHMESLSSVSVPQHIGLDPEKLPTIAQENTAAVHELGHVTTGSFYTVSSPCDERRRCEIRADRAAIVRHIDKEELLRLLEGEKRPLWEIAEHFGFTEEFIRKALCLYRNGNLAPEYYS